ncbi:MAG: alpha/beta hydrolase [Burkholderiales bacterium]
MKKKTLALLIAVPLAILAGAAGLAITLGAPGDPPVMASINNPFKGVDYSDLPPARHFTARDGAKLAYRAYEAVPRSAVNGSVVLVHGSSAAGSTMHVMAKAFAAACYAAYALDVRGHGDSGRKGQIAYVGQLEDDLEDFARSVNPARPATLAGFSSGGGFVLRFAGDARQKLFSSYLLLSPFLARDAPTSRPEGGRWASVGVARYVAVSVLDAAGLRMSGQPLRLVAGRDDELFYAERFADVFKAAGKDVSVALVPGTGHVGLILQPAAIEAAIAAVRSLRPSLSPRA